MLKILQARLQQYVNWELADIQAGFWKGRDQIATIRGSQRKQGDSRKKTSTVSLTTLKPLTVWIIANCGKFLKGWECHTISPGSWETCMWVERQQLEPNMEQWTGSELRKEYVKAVYCRPAYLIYMQNACMRAKSLQLCPTLCNLWTVAHQAPLSMEFCRQEYWGGLPCHPPGDLPNPGIEPMSPALQAVSLPLSHEGSP